MTCHPRFDLADQWSRLCDGHESPADVAASLDVWRRECSLLADVENLRDVPGMTWDRSTADELLRYLLTRAHAGDQIAHRTVLQAYLPALWRGHDTEEAAEVLGVAWTLILQAPIDGSVKLSTWLGLKIRHARPERLTRQVQTVSATSEWSEAGGVSELEDAFEWEGLVDRLPTADRRLLEMLFVEGYTVSEIAHELGISAAAVSKRRGRALQRVRDRLPRLVAA